MMKRRDFMKRTTLAAFAALWPVIPPPCVDKAVIFDPTVAQGACVRFNLNSREDKLEDVYDRGKKLLEDGWVKKRVPSRYRSRLSYHDGNMVFYSGNGGWAQIRVTYMPELKSKKVG